jgi:hypothetical protein
MPRQFYGIPRFPNDPLNQRSYYNDLTGKELRHKMGPKCCRWNPDRFRILDGLIWRPAVMTLSRHSRWKHSHIEQIHDLSLSFITVISCIKQHGWSRHVALLMKHKRVENFICKLERNHLRRSKWKDNINTSGKTKQHVWV